VNKNISKRASNLFISWYTYRCIAGKPIDKQNQQLNSQSKIPKSSFDSFLESVDCKVFSGCTACVVTLKINIKLMSQQTHVLKGSKFNI